MLSPESLQLGMMLAETSMLENAVGDLLAKPELLVLTDASPAAKTAVRQHIRKWRHGVKRRLSTDCITENLKKELELYQQAVGMSHGEFEQNCRDMAKKLEGKSHFYLEARRLIDRNGKTHNPMFQEYFCDKWHQHLAESIKKAQKRELAIHKDKLLKELYQRIETFKTLEEVREHGDANQSGRLWDMASAKMTRTDIVLLKRFIRFLKDNPELQEIANKLGRMANETDDPSLHKSPAEELRLVEEKSDLVADDIVGIHQSDHLDKMVPAETLFLAEPELEILFYKHFADKRLMTYRMQGASRTLRKVKAFKPANKKVEVEKGPFLICVDASGSMNGFPEQAAKAMAYALLDIALSESRDCVVTLFSTDHISYEFTGERGLREAMDFLSYSFHGGTDLEPALNHAIDLMETDRYVNADLVVISDFIAPEQPQPLIERIGKLKSKHNRFHAVNLSKYGNPSLMNMFNHCWEYCPSLLNRIVKRF
ncbi:ATPase RavA stimulator ViaA [Veronia pacifica]|uniref:Protein viaA n=1 Tax=Veronia pacifica TaxID=1080227 RepID=A0A1C3EMV3_9GAMM|nr:ATPase RavA stimulator ViaA [Veronia pacifica]ODA34555.1 protein viaA [Veronia pacifica]